MTRLFCVGIVVAAVLFAMPAFASTPDPDNCTIAWFQPVGPNVIFVCPRVAPEATTTKLDVTVMDEFNMPISGWLVTLTFANAVCPLVHTGITDANGYVRIYIPAGVLNVGPPGSLRVNSGYTVVCLGVTIGSGTVAVVSPEYNCTAPVGGADFGLFAQDWLFVGPGSRSDFNNDGFVRGEDFGRGRDGQPGVELQAGVQQHVERRGRVEPARLAVDPLRDLGSVGSEQRLLRLDEPVELLVAHVLRVERVGVALLRLAAEPDLPGVGSEDAGFDELCAPGRRGVHFVSSLLCGGAGAVEDGERARDGRRQRERPE